MKIIRVKDYNEMSKTAAELFFTKIKERPSLHLGLATGGTPVGMYEKLTEMLRSSTVSTGSLKIFNLDEYAGLPQNDPNSYFSFMKKHVYNPWGLKADQCFIPDGTAKNLEEECRRYEALLDEHGVDIQLLGAGENGHIGFNEPGTPFHSETHVEKLKNTTREANARFFPSLEEVPTHAVTMGISSILKAKEIVLIASGEAKAEAINSLVNSAMTEEWPITALQQHPEVTVIVDEAAAASI
ncbi:glucosamine-6-phosphate deaminase [Evansella clarkii]|uniref:glucosamine-6-phosphate deaminase n=1 Tax=Evansella clarkii TaxID=79879 RepID=UPI000B448676|nr:glucosamine-6-phosphate deaminase [Evansella clarkii]